MKQDDTFSVGFIIDGEGGIPTADQPIRVPYCMLNPNCLNDGFQYHMSKLDQHGNERGQLSQPYNYNGDNHYALSTIGDLRFYRINILRRSDKMLDITIYEKNGEELIEKKKQTDSPDHDKWLSVDDAFPKQYLSVQTNGSPGSVLKFQISTRHGSTTQTEFAEGDFAFKSDDKRIAGAYCYVQAPNPLGVTSQLIYCDVPVLA